REDRLAEADERTRDARDRVPAAPVGSDERDLRRGRDALLAAAEGDPLPVGRPVGGCDVDPPGREPAKAAAGRVDEVERRDRPLVRPSPRRTVSASPT